MAYRLQWEQQFDFPVSMVALDRAGSAVLAVLEGNRSVILDNSGRKLWSHQFREDVTICHVSDGGRPAVFYCGKVLYVVDPKNEKAKAVRAEFSADALAVRPRTSLIFLGNRYGLYRQMLTNGKIIARGDLGHGIEFLSFSPDASHIVAADAGGRTTLMQSSAEKCWTIPLNDTIRAVDITNAAERVVAIGTKSIYLVDQLGTTIDELGMEAQPISINVHPDGDEMVFVTRKGAVHRVGIDGSHIDAFEFGMEAIIKPDATGMHVCVVKADGKGSNMQFFADETAARPTRIARPAKAERDTIDGRGDAADYIEVD